MALATVTIHTIVQNSQDLDSRHPASEHLRSKVFYRVDLNGQSYEMECEATQPYGTAYDSELEVGGYRGPLAGGPWNHGAFRDEVDRIFKTRVLKVSGKPSGIIMRDNTFAGLNERFTFELPG